MVAHGNHATNHGVKCLHQEGVQQGQGRVKPSALDRPPPSPLPLPPQWPYSQALSCRCLASGQAQEGSPGKSCSLLPLDPAYLLLAALRPSANWPVCPVGQLLCRAPGRGGGQRSGLCLCSLVIWGRPVPPPAFCSLWLPPTGRVHRPDAQAGAGPQGRGRQPAGPLLPDTPTHQEAAPLGSSHSASVPTWPLWPPQGQNRALASLTSCRGGQ